MTQTINEILLELESNQSRLFKEDLLKSHKDNQLLKQVFFKALDPFTNYHIKKIPSFTSTPLSSLSLQEAIDKLDVLSSRKVTGNAAINYLKNLLSSVDSDSAEVIVKIIRRDLRCGVSVATVNKIWENLIFTYPCLLCSPFDTKTIKNIIWSAYGQLKADGLRFNAIVHENMCSFYSRKGQLIEIDDQDFYDEFIKFANGASIVFDGELVAYKDGVLLPRKESNGLANKAIKGTISKDESKMFQAVIWDEIRLEDFKKGHSSIPYDERLESLTDKVNTMYTDEYIVISQLKFGFNRISLIDTFECRDLAHAQEKFNEYRAMKCEGIIIKNKKSLWSDTRSKEQIKLKAEQECDLRVIGWNFGEVGTKNEHRLGSLQCSSEDGKVIVNISGFTDEERDTITAEYAIGKIVSVLYNERINKKNGGVDSLFLPRIVEFRFDKTVADTSELIK